MGTDKTGVVKTHRVKLKKSPMEKLASVVIYILLTAIGLITLYPFIFILSSSISDPHEVLLMHVKLWPVGLSFEGMKLVLTNANVWRGYYNTLWYVVVGCLLNVTTTVTFAYPLSRKEFTARKYFMLFMALPMFFAGGTIPSFIVVTKLGLMNTRWAIVLPSAIMLVGIIITRVFFQTTIPDSLVESAKIDGANDVSVLLRIVLPLSLPVVAVISLYAAVVFWNMYTPALYYLPSVPKLQPLQVYLQRILIANVSDVNSPDVNAFKRAMMAIQIKYAIIVVATVPILCTYPFIQKYFVTGVMIGAVKE